MRYRPPGVGPLVEHPRDVADVTPRRAVRAAAGLLLVGLLTHGSAQARGTAVAILLPGAEYHRRELPPDPSVGWWVLHRPAGITVLEPLPVVVTAVRTCGDADHEQSGRAVSVPGARDPILLMRGPLDLTLGVVHTAFLDDAGAGEAPQVAVRWGGQRVVVRHVATLPPGGKPGRYRIELTVGARHFSLHADQWHGDGHWRVRWIGDLNRDDWPDLLVDASYKYSVHTTRLYLSRARDGRTTVREVARVDHTAC